MSINLKLFVTHALDDSDLMSSYTDKTCEQLDIFAEKGGDLEKLHAEVTKIKVNGPEIAAAKAVLLWAINDMIENPD
jgi:predicted secreted protein